MPPLGDRGLREDSGHFPKNSGRAKKIYCLILWGIVYMKEFLTDGVITTAGKSDLKKILSLQKLAYLKEGERYNDFNIPPLTQTTGEIESEFDGSVFLKLVIDGRITGSVKGKKISDTCHVGRLMVHPDFQRRGFGRELVRRIEIEFIADKEIHRFELFTGELSLENINLYRSLGYTVFKTEPFGNGYNIVFMEKNVNV